MVQVTVSEGILEGEIVQNPYGGEFCSFKGVPFAAPPVEDLRFKDPQPPKPWSGIRKATQFAPISMQVDSLSQKIPTNASEDCLYLNVNTPTITPNKPLPVIVWIHGGGFKVGCGNDDFYGPELLIQENIIIVCIHYRLDTLGFLSLGTEDIPGNAGMKDQVAALRWVKKNIKNFGGDPENITIYGESAGGASVSFHLISPMSKGLFKRAIQASGSCNTVWAIQPRARERAEALARKLGCYSTDDKELYEFFKSVPADKLVDQSIPLTYFETGSKLRLYFSIVNEKLFGKNERFWYGDVNDVLRNKGIHEGVEVLSGFTKDEGAYFIISDLDKKICDANLYYEYFVPDILVDKTTVDKQIEIGKKIKERYFGNGPVSIDNKIDLARICGVESFKLPLIEFAKAVSRRNKVFFYNFKSFSDRNLTVALMNAESLFGNQNLTCHCDDNFYIFHSKVMGKHDQNKEGYRISKMLTKLWTDFAKYGNPTPDNTFGVQWIPFTEENQNFMEIDNMLTPSRFPEQDEIEFWEAIIKQYYPKYVH